MKTIEIAPSLQNTHILHDNMIIGRMSDGSRTYVYDLPEGYTFPRAGRKEFKRVFSTAIAMASKIWQAEDAINNVFMGYGQSHIAGKLTVIEGPAPWIKPCPKFDLAKCPKFSDR